MKGNAMLYDQKWQKKTDAATILSVAADLIEQRGLSKFALEDERGGLCINGAIFKALDGEWDDEHPAVRAVRSHFGEHSGHVKWNNAPERTAGDVVALLRNLAA